MLQRRIENSNASKNKSCLPVTNVINDYKAKTAYSNIIKCCVCKCNILETLSEEVDNSDNERNLNLVDRRFEKFHKCRSTCQTVNEDENIQAPPAPLEIRSISHLDKMMFYPVLNNCELASYLPENEENEEEDNSENGDDDNPALDALLELLDDEDSQPPVNDQMVEDVKSFTVFSPNSSKVKTVIRKKFDVKTDLLKIIYSGSEFHQDSISFLYASQANKYLSNVNYFNGTIANQDQRYIQVEAYDNDLHIRGSSRYNSKIYDELHFRMAQLGQVCLKLSIHLSQENEVTLASALMQQNKVVTVTLVGDQTNELQRSYYVHNHSSDTNCQNDCDKVSLHDYLQTDDSTKNHLKNKFVPTFLLTASKKMEEIVNLVKYPSSPLYSEDYFFQLVFHLNGNITIQGFLWPVSFKAFNTTIADNSFTGEVNIEVENKFLKELEETVLTTSDKERLSEKLKLSPEKLDELSSKVEKYQIHIDPTCRNCPPLELPCLETLVSRELQTLENSYSVRRFLDILLSFLRRLSNFGKNSLSVIEWLDHIEEERVEDLVIDEEKISVKIEDEVLDFKKDDYLLSLLNKWKDENTIVPLYQYCVSQSKFGYQSVLLKRSFVRDSFTHPFSDVILRAENSTQTLEPIFGSMDLSNKVECYGGHSTHYMSNHQEISLAEFISLMDQRKFRVISSRPVQYVHTLPQTKLLFMRSNAQTETSYSVENDPRTLYEMIETVVTRYFKRINARKICLSELCIWYEVLPAEKSAEIFQAYSNKIQLVEESEIETLNGTDMLPQYILCTNSDVFVKRKKSKIMKHPTVEYLSSEYKFMKVLLFLPHDNYEDLNEEVTIDLMFNKLKDQSTIRLVEFNER